MHDRPHSNGKALSLMIVGLIALGGAFAILGTLPAPANAAACDQGGGLISGNWVITTTQVCSGIQYTVDGSITINAGGNLTLVNGGFTFVKDAKHRGSTLNVNAGGVLILDNSLVTTETTMIQPYLKLAFTVNSTGTLVMRDHSTLKFPGWFNATGAAITLWDSTITGFTPGELTGVGVYVGDNDNSPLIAWSSTTASLYRSAIARIYENQSASTGTNVTGTIEGNVSLSGGSTLYAYDSYIAVDYSNVLGLHNELQVDGTSSAYLYNVTIDRSEDPFLESDWQPAFRPLAAGGAVYLLRWLHAQVLDSTGFPISGATIWSALSPAGSTAQYPDNGLSTTPSAATLAYLGKTASGATAWNRTDPTGWAVIPLYTDRVVVTSLPNAVSFGNYMVTSSFSATTAQMGVNFNPYPAVSVPDNNIWVSIPMSAVTVRTGPDLALKQSDYPTTLKPIVGQTFTIHAPVYNLGQTSASNVSLVAWLNGSSANQLGSVNGLYVAAGTMVNVSIGIQGIATVGPHFVELAVNPNRTINEGGGLAYTNNYANVSVDVQPPPQGFVQISGPNEGASVNPGTSIPVSGFIHDLQGAPVPGVSVTIELVSSSGTTPISETTAITDGSGFFLAQLAIPAGTADGSYRVVVTSSASSISPDSRTIAVQAPASFLNQPVPLLGIPWWLFLIFLAVVIVAAIGVTAYFKVYGIGKMVECGECGSFIPQDAIRCPKCGVEFEKDMAKCSNCGTWIPIDVKECPECGVKFASGELDLADYQERMRLQYDEVVQRLKTDASRQLGRTLSDAEFQEWWRKQPTFVTFEDWLHEEEDMRKQGSKACPVCGTLNSVTAKVCHKCGSLMRSAPTPTAGPVRVGAPKRTPRTVAPSEEAGGETAPAPPRTNGPIVQKKVVKRGPTEGEPTEGQDQSQDNQDL